jgi:hypothetical protein
LKLEPLKLGCIVLWLQLHQNYETYFRILEATCGSSFGNCFISFNIEYTVRFRTGAFGAIGDGAIGAEVVGATVIGA